MHVLFKIVLEFSFIFYVLEKQKILFSPKPCTTFARMKYSRVLYGYKLFKNNNNKIIVVSKIISKVNFCYIAYLQGFHFVDCFFFLPQSYISY